VVSLHATPERLIQVRQNRLLSIGVGPGNDGLYRPAVRTEEVAFARRLSVKYNWALLDVTRRSIEETAAAVPELFTDRQRHACRMTVWRGTKPLIWPSQSPCAAGALANAACLRGDPRRTDEPAIQAASALRRPEKIAALLARDKALFVRQTTRDRFVVGADQTLILGERLFSSRRPVAQAAAQLRALAGQSHDCIPLSPLSAMKIVSSTFQLRA